MERRKATIYRRLTALAVVGLFTCVCRAAPTVTFEVDPSNTAPGVTARRFVVDGQGIDWTSAELLLVLTRGSVYNDPGFDSDAPQPAFWGVPTLEALEFDTWVGIPGDLTNVIAGSAVDFGSGTFSMSGDTISTLWFTTTATDTGPTRIANISLTNDAVGTWQMIVTFANSPNIVLSGVIILEPGALALYGFIGLGGLGRARRVR